MRNQIYQAVISGAKGFLWYTYAQTANYPDLGIGMPWLSHEVADLKDAILAPPKELDIQVEAEHPEHLHISTRRVDDHLFLFAVNTAKVAQEVKLTLPGLDEKRLQVVSENRQVPVIGGVLSDHFDTYATHVYTTDSGLEDRPVIEEVIREIASADAARQKPGNLAFEGNGTWVEFSSKSTYGSTPNRVLDGVTDGMRWRDGTPKKTPDWLTVRFPQPASIGRVVVYSGTISAVEVQVPDLQEGWRTVGSTEDTMGDNLEILLEAPMKTDALRVLITALREGEDYSLIHELEAYAD
ncbi:MAG: discoidin domain-containing protein [Gemmatimonadetes bacterium]|nr:discoidin domain-containing protein [Gemmatimonadota bacterium]MBT7914523.1 discoidin domain-containing protein [Candidatus Bathyarchaeota archaeon]